MSKKRSKVPPPTKQGGLRSIPCRKPTASRSHRWRLRAEGFRELILSHGWRPFGNRARKSIRGREVTMFFCRQDAGHLTADPPYFLCQFRIKEDACARDARHRSALERRRAFYLVQSKTGREAP